MRVLFSITPVVLSMLTACAPSANDLDKAPPLAILGGESHDIGALQVEELLTAADGLDRPRDVALHPEDATQLWVVNEGDSSMLIAFDVGSDAQRTEKRAAEGHTHFMPQPSALAFGDGNLATVHEEDQPTQGNMTPGDFMGPSLWPADADAFDGGHNSHLDMLHNSPLAMGIAWETANVYWVFDGAHGSLTRYDFGDDHGPGGTIHDDGVVERYVEGEVRMVRGVSSHLELDAEAGLLYVADTGNGRIAVLDINTGTKGAPIFPNYDGGLQHRMEGAALSTFFAGDEEVAVGQPSGLALHDGVLYVSDREKRQIQGYSLDGESLGYLKTGIDAVAGIAFDPEGRLYVVDTEGARVLRLSVSE